MNVLGLRDPIGFEDLAQGRQSQRRLGKMDFAYACFGHGKPIMTNAATAFSRKWGALS